MTDIDLVMACAEAMGLSPIVVSNDGCFVGLPSDVIVTVRDKRGGKTIYDPLHDDNKMVALVKKFQLAVFWQEGWHVDAPCIANEYASNADLNRAVCECVAAMRAKK